MRHRFVLMAVPLFLAACGGVAVSLTTDAAEYQPGDTVELQLRNEGPREVGFNLCFARLERREGSGWTHTPHVAGDAFCRAVQYPLDVGASAIGTLRLPAELPAGEYRVVHEVDTRRRDSEGRSVQSAVASAPFRVGEAGTPGS